MASVLNSTLRRPRRHALGLAALAALCASSAWAQTQTVTITGRGITPSLAVTGFDDTPLSSAPFSAGSVNAAQLLDAGSRQLSDLTRTDPGVNDAYNAEGYWSILSVRGYTLDNRFNYRRDGLPISAETALALDNKERIEVLKGTSGIQAGTSAPGGLVNLVVKRPERTLRSVRLEAREGGGGAAAVDLSQRFGASEAFGLRLNAASERISPQLRNAKGERHLAALAADWRLSSSSLLEAAFEWSRQSQPSQPGFSLLGDGVPDAKAVNPRVNLNNQPWSQPVVLQGQTASLRWTQGLGQDWRAQAHLGLQRLRSDDRVAFPFGCYDAVNDLYYADRYCPDGSFDLYDFRSDNERRNTDALDLSLVGRFATVGIAHQLTTGVLLSRFRSRFQRQAFNFAGQGHIDGTLLTLAAGDLTDENTHRDERSTEWYLRDAMKLGEQWRLWAGVRHTRLQRDSVRTDGSRATAYTQSATLPFFALSHQLTPQSMLYASWGQGLESDVAPNRARYTNAGVALPALKSRQVELGWKHESTDADASVVVFDIDRPVAEDIGTCDVDASCTRRIDGSARHRGVEAQWGRRLGAWTLRAGGTALHARRQGSSRPELNGTRPSNVPATSLRLSASHAFAAPAGLSAGLAVVHEGDRVVVPGATQRIGAWTRVDLSARWLQRTEAATLTWRVGLDNAADNRAWKEAPYQFGHAYLYPLAPRTLRASLQAEF